MTPSSNSSQDECFGKNYSSFLDFTRNYKRTSGFFVPWIVLQMYYCFIVYPTFTLMIDSYIIV